MVTALAIKNEIDVLILAECEIDRGKLLRSLNQDSLDPASEPIFHLTQSRSRCATILTRFSRSFLTARDENDWISIRDLRLPGSIPLSLVALHLPSKLFRTEASQAQQCAVLSEQIRDAERRAGHRHTVIVGDFNMNPFEAGVVSAAGLNATMSRAIAAKEFRTVDNKSYPFFYNPVWNLFGDDKSAPGTYFYRRNEHVSYFWNVFDQLLVRPALLNRLPSPAVEMLTEAGGAALLTKNGLPDKHSASDHLPILFRLNLELEPTP